MNPELDLKVSEAQAKTATLIEEMSKLLIGQKHVADSLVMGLLVGGHVLLEGLPGLAKTTSVKALAESSNLAVKRIQFTPDLLLPMLSVLKYTTLKKLILKLAEVQYSRTFLLQMKSTELLQKFSQLC